MMHKTLVFTALFVTVGSMVWCDPVKAQPIIEFRILPPGHDLELKKGVRVRYYPLDEYLQLAQFDSELWTALRQVETYQEIERVLQTKLDAQDGIIRTLEDDKRILGDRSLRLEDSWQKCENSLAAASIGTIWPYIVAAGGTVLGIVGTTLWLTSR